MKTIINYFKMDTNVALWAKIITILGLILSVTVELFFATLILWYGIAELFTDIPFWGIILFIITLTGYGYMLVRIIKHIREEVELAEKGYIEE